MAELTPEKICNFIFKYFDFDLNILKNNVLSNTITLNIELCINHELT